MVVPLTDGDRQMCSMCHRPLSFWFSQQSDGKKGERFESRGRGIRPLPTPLSNVGFFHELTASNECSAHLILPGTISNGLLHGFHSELDLDDVTHKKTTGHFLHYERQLQVLPASGTNDLLVPFALLFPFRLRWSLHSFETLSS